jgi:hypothetical protein
VDCGRTQILLPTELTVRRADTTEAIGNALVAKANGAGHPHHRRESGSPGIDRAPRAPRRPRRTCRPAVPTKACRKS